MTHCSHSWKCIDSRKPGYKHPNGYPTYKDQILPGKCFKQRTYKCLECGKKVKTEEYVMGALKTARIAISKVVLLENATNI